MYWNKYTKTLDIIIWKEYYITIKNKKTNTNKKTQETQEKEVKNLKFILESAQEDIEILKKQSEEEINKAAETSKKVKENLDKQKFQKMKTGYDNDPSMYSIFRYDDVGF